MTDGTSHRSLVSLTASLALCWCVCLAVGGCRDGAGDSESSERALREKLERRAASRPPKASLNLGTIHRATDIYASDTLAVETDDGTQLEVEEAYLVISAIEVHACEPGLDEFRAGEGERMLNDLRDLVVSRAYAHVPSSATRLGTPFVEDLFSKSGRARIIGEISPPLASYCRIYAVLAPADRDVMNTTPASTDDLVGRTLLVRGRWRQSPDAEWTDFDIESDARQVVKLRAVDPQTGTSPLVLDNPGASSMVLIDKEIRPETFAVSPNSEDAAPRILQNLTETFQVHTF